MSVVVRPLPIQEEERVVTVLQQIESCYAAIADSPGEMSILNQNIQLLENTVLSFDEDATLTKTVLEAITGEVRQKLREAYRSWETQLEYEFAHRVINNEALPDEYFLYERQMTHTRQELELIGDTSGKRILIIGSGAFPISAIHYHLQTGLTIDCIGRDRDAVSMALQAVTEAGLFNAIRIFREEDPDFNVSDYDIVVIEALVTPRKNILNKLRKRGRRGVQVLCRTALALRALFYEEITDRDVRGFHIRREQVAKGNQILSTWLIEPGGSAAAHAQLEWVKRIDAEMAAQILRLMNRTLEEETTIGFPGPLDHETGYALMRQLNADVESDRRHVLVAEKDGQIVGQLILTPNSSPNHRHIVELTRGTIDRSFRGGGLALRAFREVAKKCEELGREVICLDVRAGTLAAMWWQHFGFRPYGLLADYSRVGNKRYQGLYLTQSTEELKERLKEIEAGNAGAQPQYPISIHDLSQDGKAALED
jgi:predicted GNAT family N-acyltransferase